MSVKYWLARISVALTIAMAGIGLTVHQTHATPHSEPVPVFMPIMTPRPASEGLRLTGADMDTCTRWHVCGTDLGIPFRMKDGVVGYLFGDTFAIPDPARQVGMAGWHAPVLLYSDMTPSPEGPLEFSGAAGVTGDGMVPDIMPNGHQVNGEYSVIPNDGIYFPETGDTIVSYMSIHSWTDTEFESWQTNNSGLAISHDGQHFDRIGPVWENDATNEDPFQMVSMQRDGEFVYIVSDRAGRQDGPMLLRRVPWNRMFDKSAYECFNGTDWGGNCAPMAYGTGRDKYLMEGRYGEPSLRKLRDDIWVLSYLELVKDPSTHQDMWQIVTQTAPYLGAPWSEKKVQVTENQFPRLYGGFIHPDSTATDLILIVSTWRDATDGQPARYDVTPFHGTL